MFGVGYGSMLTHVFRPLSCNIFSDLILLSNGAAYGDRTKNLFSVFNQFLIDHKLLKDPHGDNRTLYSLRHMYATMRLVEDGIPVHQLAKQMGTSIQMIDKYYSHLQPMMIAEKLAGKRPEKKPVKRKKPL